MAKDRSKYINNFPFIILVVVAIILIILVNVYLNLKPDSIISFNGYMVLEGDATYNLMNNYTITEDMNADAVQVYNGDYVYKQLDSYFVGTKEKQEIDYTYPAYSNDGITLYTINEDVNLIRDDFKVVEGYSGLSISYGMLYNVGDETPIDDHSYIFLDLKNSIYVNTLSMTVKTLNNEYEIIVNSPIYFNTKYINYYTFDGVNFKYNRIDDIYYDSIIKIGDYTLTYEEFLLNMGLIKSSNVSEDKEEDTTNNESDNIPSDDEITQVYQKPTVSISDFSIGSYYISSNLVINDPSNVITSYPTFEIYDENEKLILRKKISNLGDFIIKGLLPNIKYHVVGTFEYKNEFGLNVENIFYDNYLTTNSIDSLDPINLSLEAGNRYSNKIEIKNLKILNIDNEALYGITRIALKVGENQYNVSYSDITKLLLGESVTVSTSKNLKSNTVYEYEIKFYDKANNELKTTGMYSGTVKTSKETPTLSLNSSIENQDILISLTTKNKDDVYIYDYEYELYSYTGYLIGDGSLNYNDGEINQFSFENLDYGTNYILKVSGTYDLEDGNGEQELNYKYEFTIDNIGNLTVFYDTSNTIVTSSTIDTDIYIKSISAFERESTKIYVYLTDLDGNDILNEDGSLKYQNIYSISDMDDYSNFYKKLDVEFNNLTSNTEYKLKIKVVIEQIEQNIEIEKYLEPNIKTLEEEASIEVINSKLLGDTLDLYFKVKDVDNKITNDNIIIEVYEGTYETIDDIISEKYVYREVIQLDKELENYINFTLSGYTSDSYTIFISANPYDEQKIKTYLQILNGNQVEEKINYALVVDRDVESSLEIYQQLLSEGKMKTEINLSYYIPFSNIDLVLIDCIDNNCKKIGTINTDGTVESAIGVTIEDSTNNMLKDYVNRKTDKRITVINEKNQVHNLYLAVNKIIGESFDNVYLDDYYILNELEYDTNTEIYNISNVDDFYAIANTKNQYVVTSDLDFKENNKTLNFYGIIDFQGYNLNLYENATSKSNLISSLGSSSNKTATLKNFTINYEIGFEGVKTNDYGFVSYNNGTIENFIVNVSQLNESARSRFGLVSIYNYGLINNFAIYVNSSIDTYYYSGFVIYSNQKSGCVSNGYVATLDVTNKIYAHDNSARYGTFAFANYGLIKNVYNLVDVVSVDNGVVSSIVYSNNEIDSIVRNTLSVATVTKINNNGPNVYSTGARSKSYNNYYYDTNPQNLTYTNSYNQTINKTALRNTGVLEVILNSDVEDAFSMISGYYPILKMSNFMDDKQVLIPISFNYTESSIDIISTEFISQDKSLGSAEIGVYISNPDNLEIISIDVADISNEEIIDHSYDQNNQITYVKLKIMLGETDLVKSLYEINKFTYMTENSTKKEKEYLTNKPRIEVDMYRPVGNYSGLVNAINSNENIFLTQNIKYDEKTSLPANVTYSSIFDGNEKTLDLENLQLTNGYFMYYVSNGEIKNLQVVNMKIDIDEENYNSSNNYLGFIRYSNYSSFENIDISNSEITLKGNGLITQIGTFISHSYASSINKVSVNNLKIKIDHTSTQTLSVGGIVGYQYSSNIQNSYIYNFDIDANYANLAGIKPIGGIVASSYYYTQIYNCYAYGNISSNSNYLGGILGFSNYGESYSSYVTNSYSYVNIISSGDYLGGIVGISGAARAKVKNNMFIGKIDNVNSNSNVSNITINAVSSNNYDLDGTSFIKIPNIENSEIPNYKIFDANEAFSINDSTLPYLINSSFVDQQIKNISLTDFEGLSYEIEYLDENGSIIDDNTLASSAYLYINSEIVCTSDAGECYNEDKTLKIEKDTNYSSESGIHKYKIVPNNIYVSAYDIELKDDVVKKISFKFYRKISNAEEWKNISTNDSENIIIMNNINLSEFENVDELIDKKLNNVLCKQSSCTISGGYTGDDSIVLGSRLIYSLSGTMRNVNFENIVIKRDSYYVGLVGYNTGTIENCNFYNLTIEGTKDRVGIVAFNNGHINGIEMKNVKISGVNCIGGLVGFDYNFGSLITNVNASKIEINASDSYVGGLIGYMNNVTGSANYLYNLNVNDSVINGKSYVGGIIGYNHNTYTSTNLSESSVVGLKIIATGNYIGGAVGYSNFVTNVAVSDLQIINDSSNILKNVGGIVGYTLRPITYSSVENILIGSTTEDSDGNVKLNAINATNVGGIAGTASYVQNSYVRNSTIYATDNVGGLLGTVYVTVSEIKQNTVSKTDVIATGNNAGGIIGYYFASYYNNKPSINNNEVISSSGENYIQASNNAGGIIGYLKNDTDLMQIFAFEYNYVENYTISVTNSDDSTTAGGLIGKMYKLPISTDKRFSTSLFYGNISSDSQYGTGKIDNYSSSPSYSNVEDAYNFSVSSNFKQYVTSITDDYNNSQISSESNISYSNSFNKTNGYFPILKNYTYLRDFTTDNGEHITEDDRVEIPISTQTSMSTYGLLSSRRYLLARKIPIDLEYEVYASDVNKLNIEFSSVDQSVSFYYEIGDYTSDIVTVNQRTFTITYDFKNPIKIYLTNGSTLENKTFKVEDLSRSISIVNNETYYLSNNLLYSESGAINGNFVNLYGNKALSSDGNIYNILDKTLTQEVIDYKMINTIPLYEFNYNGQNIETYYNYSIVDGIIKDYQIFVKQNNLSIVDSSLNNKKDSYVIDFYNNKEIQLILKSDGILYNLKDEINYPDDIVNKNIKDMYSDINSNSTLVVIQYENGEIYTFDYNTGEKIYSNKYNSDMNLLEYITSRLNSNSSSNTINNISSLSEYEEIQKLEEKLTLNSVEDATNKIYQNNSSTNKNSNYTTVYNPVTQKYDIYEVNELLSNDVETMSENDKIYKDYELVQFYSNSNNKNENKSLNGILIFALTIVSILTALYLLINRKRVRKVV